MVQTVLKNLHKQEAFFIYGYGTMFRSYVFFVLCSLFNNFFV